MSRFLTLNIFLFFLYSFNLSSSVGKPSKEITLNDAIEYAFENNNLLKAHEEEIKAFEGGIVASASDFYPKIGVVGGISYEKPANIQANDEEILPLGYVYVDYNIFNGFKNLNELKKTKILKKIAKSKFVQAKAKLRTSIERHFYNFLFVKEKITHYEKSLDLNQKHIKSLNRRRRSGLVSKSDLLEFQLRDSYLKSEINSLVLNLNKIKLSIIRLMGPNLGINFVPIGRIPHLHLLGEINEYLEVVKKKSEETKQALFELEAAENENKIARGSWFPSIDVTGRVGTLGHEFGSTREDFEVQGQVSLNWELFSGFKTKGESARANAELQKKRFELNQKILTAMAEIELGIRRIKSIEQRVDLEENNETKAEKLYKSTLSEYRRGVKNSSDLKSSEETLLEARVRRAEFKLNFIEEKLNLEEKHNIIIRVKKLKDLHTKKT